jgi:hypothetical protein
MDYFKLGFGVFFIVLGCISLYAYITKNEKLFWKKDRMIKFWGEKLGTTIHFIGYVIFPILLGIFLVVTQFI